MNILNKPDGEKRTQANPVRTLIVIAALVILIGPVFYFIIFHHGFSDNSNDWSNFASFSSYFSGIASLSILGYISFIAFKANETYNRLTIKPILILSNKKSQKFHPRQNSWYVVNGSKHAALDLLVRYKLANDGIFSKWVACSSLSDNNEIELFFIHEAYCIEILYTDITGDNKYRFVMQDFVSITKNITDIEYENEFLVSQKSKINIALLNDEFRENYDEVNNDVPKYFTSYIKPKIFGLSASLYDKGIRNSE